VADDYRPQGKTLEALDRGMKLVESVPYKVSLRWLFYRLLQEGIYSCKQDYKNKCIPTFSRARKRFWNGWNPTTLADDTREAIMRGDGFESGRSWLKDGIGFGLKCNLDYWLSQPYYVLVLFEAKAMIGQFEHYAPPFISLYPFGGDPSLAYKFKIAQDIDQAHEDKEIVLIYFGDFDPKGLQIYESAMEDISLWAGQPFEAIRAGLTLEQATGYNLPENFERPGAFQWEALEDAQAEEIITDALASYIDHEAAEQVEADEQLVTTGFRGAWEAVGFEAMATYLFGDDEDETE